MLLPSLSEADECECCPCVELPKTLFKWNVGCVEPEEESDEGEAEEISPLATDRPDFTETSSTVGLGRWQLEAGYTYTHDSSGGSTTNAGSYPETLLRVGMFAEWFEFRVGWNYADERQSNPAQRLSGGEDLYLGIKLALTEQSDLWPEMALTPQMTVPTGGADFTANAVLPGVNWLYSWELNECYGFGGSTQANRAIDQNGNAYAEVAQSLTVGRCFSDCLGGYVEWYGFFPNGATDGVTSVEHYLNGGFTFPIHENLQLDLRAGVGLNERSDDFFTGSGFGWRY